MGEVDAAIEEVSQDEVTPWTRPPKLETPADKSSDGDQLRVMRSSAQGKKLEVPAKTQRGNASQEKNRRGEKNLNLSKGAKKGEASDAEQLSMVCASCSFFF